MSKVRLGYTTSDVTLSISPNGYTYYYGILEYRVYKGEDYNGHDVFGRDGSYWRGFFFDGQQHGFGTYVDERGAEYIRSYCLGNKSNKSQQISKTPKQPKDAVKIVLPFEQTQPELPEYHAKYKDIEIPPLFEGYYKGDLKDGIPHGKGDFVFNSGLLRYNGDFSDGLFNGEGTLFKMDGDINAEIICCHGTWKDNDFMEPSQYTDGVYHVPKHGYTPIADRPDNAVQHHLRKKIKERKEFSEGWYLTLSDGEKVIFRTHTNDAMERKMFFYNSVSEKHKDICLKVYVLDAAKQYFHSTFIISEDYEVGDKLDRILDKKHENAPAKEIDEIFFKIGETAAKINQFQIGHNHPFVAERTPWEDYIADKIRNLTGFCKEKVITHPEIKKIANAMRNQKVENTLSLLHLNMNPNNLLYRNGGILIFNMGQCTFGDPLYELASIEASRERTRFVIDGYKSVCKDLDLDSAPYYIYKLERLGYKSGYEPGYYYLEEDKKDEFIATKERLLSLI